MAVNPAHKPKVRPGGKIPVMLTRSAPLTVGLLLAAASAAAAHPLPTNRYDRTVAVRLSPQGVRVNYSLDVSLLTLHLEQNSLFTAEEIAKLDKTPTGYAKAIAAKLGPLVADRLHAKADDKLLAFRVEKVNVHLTDHARFDYVLRADWPAGPRKRTLAFTDDNFPEKPGVVAVTLDKENVPGNTLDLLDSEEPPVGLRNRPAEDLKPEERAKLRSASAVVELPAGVEPPPPAAPPPEPTVNAGERPSLAADLARRGLPALFDSPLGVGVLLFAALVFGAAHAFTPGHGKTLVAAYLVGERGTVGHAVLLGITTTVAHTGSVLVIALILYQTYGNTVPADAARVVQFVGGLFVLIVGVWLLLLRVLGRADHVHLFAGHDHHHHHGDGGHHHHAPPPGAAKSKAGWVRVVMLGLGGGLIPCWDAVLLMIVALSMNRLGFAIPLLLAFSVGLALILVLLGVAVVTAHRAGFGRFGESRWFKALPVVSAVVLVGIGGWLCRGAIASAT
jgi:ABC-type nickel/cobalt efflux system permease component RcnA